MSQVTDFDSKRLELAEAYCKYVQDATEKDFYKEGWVPISFNEFITSEESEIWLANKSCLNELSEIMDEMEKHNVETSKKIVKIKELCNGPLARTAPYTILGQVRRMLDL